MSSNQSNQSPLRILRLVNALTPTSAPYNGFSLPQADRQNITLVTFFPSEVEVPGSLKLHNGSGTIIGFIRAVRQALAQDTYDVLHFHNSHTAVIFLLANFLNLSRYRRRLVYTVHTSYPNLKFRNRLMTWMVFLFFRRIVFCSYASYESFPSWVKRLIGRRGCVIQNGVDLERIDLFLPALSNSPAARPFTVLVVGRLIELKQPLMILEAFVQSLSDEAILIFIGEGSLRQALTERIEALGLADHVKLTGLIKRDEVYRYLTQADLFVSASTVEGLPVAVLEAMAVRCPVILSAIPPHHEIADGTNFIPLIAPDDLKGFTHALQSFANLSKDERAIIGEKCRQLVKERFSLDKMHEAYERIFRSLG